MTLMTDDSSSSQSSSTTEVQDIESDLESLEEHYNSDLRRYTANLERAFGRKNKMTKNMITNMKRKTRVKTTQNQKLIQVLEDLLRRLPRKMEGQNHEMLCLPRKMEGQNVFTFEP